MKERIIKTYESYNLDDLDLGRFSKIIDKKRYLKQNTDGTYDYGYDLDFSYMGLKSLTEIPIKFRKVYGIFDCSHNQLLSLEGAPSKVNKDFWCSDNQLISLQYAPSKVGGQFKCWRNNLLSDSCSSSLIKVKSVLFNSVQNPFKITDEVIQTVKQMTHEQKIKELDFFKEHDQKAFEMMKKILDDLGVGYGEESRKMVDRVKDNKNFKALGF